MRVIAGQWRSLSLDAPKGRDTRPTTDRVKESIMSSLESACGFEGAFVLDAFAGSGALGIEALSRGAEYACFFEKDAQAKAVILKNLATVKADKAMYRVFGTDVFKLQASASLRPFDVLIFDPPYKMPELDVIRLVRHIIEQGLLSDNAVLCYEHSAAMTLRRELWDELGMTLFKTKKMGDIAFDIILRSIT